MQLNDCAISTIKTRFSFIPAYSPITTPSYGEAVGGAVGGALGGAVGGAVGGDRTYPNTNYGGGVGGGKTSDQSPPKHDRRAIYNQKMARRNASRKRRRKYVDYDQVNQVKVQKWNNVSITIRLRLSTIYLFSSRCMFVRLFL